jgi:hypothetical protein
MMQGKDDIEFAVTSAAISCALGFRSGIDTTTNAATAAENNPHYGLRVDLRCGRTEIDTRTYKDEDLIGIRFQEFGSPLVLFVCDP